MHTKHRTLATVATVQCSSTTAQAQSNKIDPGLKRRSRLLSISHLSSRPRVQIWRN
jgi:hypothetical protein